MLPVLSRREGCSSIGISISHLQLLPVAPIACFGCALLWVTRRSVLHLGWGDRGVQAGCCGGEVWGFPRIVTDGTDLPR